MFARRRNHKGQFSISKNHKNKKINNNDNYEDDDVIIEHTPFYSSDDPKGGIAKHTLRYHKTIMEKDDDPDFGQLADMDKFSYHT